VSVESEHAAWVGLPSTRHLAAVEINHLDCTVFAGGQEFVTDVNPADRGDCLGMALEREEFLAGTCFPEEEPSESVAGGDEQAVAVTQSVGLRNV
jgi:hypothetical protein